MRSELLRFFALWHGLGYHLEVLDRVRSVVSGTLFTSTSDFVYIEGLGYQVNRHLAHAELCVRKMCTSGWRQKEREA